MEDNCFGVFAPETDIIPFDPKNIPTDVRLKDFRYMQRPWPHVNTPTQWTMDGWKTSNRRARKNRKKVHTNANRRKWYGEKKDKINEKRRKWYPKNKERANKRKRANYAKNQTKELNPYIRPEDDSDPPVISDNFDHWSAEESMRRLDTVLDKNKVAPLSTLTEDDLTGRIKNWQALTEQIDFRNPAPLFLAYLNKMIPHHSEEEIQVK
jgi:hypothetical protein